MPFLGGNVQAISAAMQRLRDATARHDPVAVGDMAEHLFDNHAQRPEDAGTALVTRARSHRPSPSAFRVFHGKAGSGGQSEPAAHMLDDLTHMPHRLQILRHRAGRRCVAVHRRKTDGILGFPPSENHRLCGAKSCLDRFSNVR
jgi:hypothetical protein